MMVTFERAGFYIFNIFLFLIFFVYYETRFISGTLHTWLMLIGCMLLLPTIIKKYVVKFFIPLDYALVLVIFFNVIVGSLVNYQAVSWPNVQAYILMLMTYVYVKENVTVKSFKFLYLVSKYFLLINGLFMVIQTLTGEYFPARYIASGESPFLIASGVSDGPTKNGMLIAIVLSFYYAKFLFKKLTFTMVDCVVLTIGFVSLLLAVSRAALLAFVIVLLVGGIFAFVAACCKKNYLLSVFRLSLLALFSVTLSVIVVSFNLGVDTLYDLRDSSADRYGLNVMLYKLQVFADASLFERFDTLFSAYDYASQSPLKILSIGFGPGTFETLYGLNVHNSYVDLLFATGVLGFLVFSVLLLYVIFRSLTADNSIYIVPLVFGLFSLMAFMLAHDVLRGRVFWVILAFIAAFPAISTQSYSSQHSEEK